METECSRCHRKFHASNHDQTVCPNCLREEFSFSPAKRSAGKTGSAIRQGNDMALRRAAARAERLSDGFQTGAALSPHAALRFVLGIVIYIICMLIFMVASGMEEWQVQSFLPGESQRVLSVLLCWVAAGLVFTSSWQSKWMLYPIVIFFVVSGWFMPDFWHGMASREKKETAAAIAASRVENSSHEPAGGLSARSSRDLTEEDLAIFRDKKQKEGDAVNYAVYINTRDVGLRQSMRTTLARLLEAKSCAAYTRAQGTLFILTNAAGGTRNISRLAARFGDLNYASPFEGIYEVAFLPDKVHAVSRYSSEVLATPTDPAFVEANLAELRNLLDPHRVRTAAAMLASANVQEKRDEVRTAILEVLRDPWAAEPETYRALIDALVVYAIAGDKETVDACRSYFLNCRLAKRVPSAPVMELLIHEAPGEMVAPVVELWCSNPVEWDSMLTQLGTRPQEHLLEVLEGTQSLQLIGAILKHLERNGTPEAAPVVKKYVSHPDSLISRTARAALRVLGE